MHRAVAGRPCGHHPQALQGSIPTEIGWTLDEPLLGPPPTPFLPLSNQETWATHREGGVISTAPRSPSDKPGEQAKLSLLNLSQKGGHHLVSFSVDSKWGR